MISQLLLAHVVMGSVAVLAGATALVAAKGAAWHRAAGTLFVLTMIVTAAAGAAVAALKPQAITLIVGVFTCYLVATSWATVRFSPNGRGALELAAAAIAVVIGLAAIAFGFQALNAGGAKDGFEPEPYFFFGGLALLAAAGDAAVALRGGIAGAQRIARHLWRMTFALFIAAGSFFTGPGAVVFPPALRDSGLLAAPELIVLALMLFWLVYVFVARRFR